MDVGTSARALVTGASGFVGTHLKRLLRDQGASVWEVERAPFARVELLTERLEAVCPTHIFHLAGVLGTAPGGWVAQHEANVLTTVNLLEAVVASRQDPWIMVASSSAVYGDTKVEENPLAEDHALRPVTPYGVSQVAREMVALQSHLAHGLRTVRVRTFNLVGPGQPESLVASSLTRQVAMAEGEGGVVTVRVGNVFPRRDYTDVRDAVRAYLLLASSALGGEVYNVCSGRSSSVQDCLDLLADLVGMPVRVEVDPARVRAVEILDQVGDPSRLQAATGWAPSIPLQSSLRDLLAWWRAQLSPASRLGVR